jgi:hypothetical protein
MGGKIEKPPASKKLKNLNGRKGLPTDSTAHIKF